MWVGAKKGENKPWDVKVWEATTGKLLATMTGHKDSVEDVAFSPDGKRLATASEDGTVRLWDAATGQEQTKWGLAAGPVTALAFSPDGGRLAAAAGQSYKACLIKVWDVTKQEEVMSLDRQDQSVWSLAYSPDGKFLARAGWDGKVRLFDAATGKLERSFSGCVRIACCVRFSGDGRTLAAGDDEGRVFLWPAGNDP
jgi:WD40 repeat protein